jgi:Winged helix DNA-binding domain
LNSDIAQRRLRNQQLVRSTLRRPEDVVAWLGAVQAQDYPGAKWAISQRTTTGVTDAAIDEAFNAGTILRTHVMRPTWHFVMPADIRRMLRLTGPRVHARSAPYHRKLGLDNATFARSHTVLEGALRGGQYLTRAELGAALRKARIAIDGLRFAFVMMHAELEAVICSGPKRGKQFTYALLDERVPTATIVDRDEALAALTTRYFTSHGPATVRDYSWWSGLTVQEARAGLEMTGSTLAHEVVDGRTYWFVPTKSARRHPPPVVHLLPNYDEHLIAYRDRGPMLSAPSSDHGLFTHQLVIDGLLAGAWRRAPGTRTVGIDVLPYRRLTKAESRALDEAVERYSRFLNASVTLCTL